jgi:hypothetical protein
VIPTAGTETGELLVTQNPATLMIFHTGEGPIKNVWLLIVLNKPTYDNLDEIVIDGTSFMTKVDFASLDSDKIPETLPNPATGYPGSTCQYNSAAISDKMDEKGDPIYYGIKPFLAEIRTTPTHFTLSLALVSPIDLKALVLALGRLDCFKNSLGINCGSSNPFNACSSFSKSTFVVPELATALLATVPFLALGAFGIRTMKRRKC